MMTWALLHDVCHIAIAKPPNGAHQPPASCARLRGSRAATTSPLHCWPDTTDGKCTSPKDITQARDFLERGAARFAGRLQRLGATRSSETIRLLLTCRRSTPDVVDSAGLLPQALDNAARCPQPDDDDYDLDSRRVFIDVPESGDTLVEVLAHLDEMVGKGLPSPEEGARSEAFYRRFFSKTEGRNEGP